MTEFQRKNFDVIVLNLMLSIIVLPFGIIYAICYLPYKLANIIMGFMGTWKQDIIEAYVNETKIPMNLDKEKMSAEEKTEREIYAKAGMNWDKENKPQ
jgi:hypothetical protein